MLVGTHCRQCSFSSAWIGTDRGAHAVGVNAAANFPIAGKIVRKAAMARFARSFALGMRSGVPVMQALTNSSQTVDNSYIAAKIEGMRDTVERGESVVRVRPLPRVFSPRSCSR